MWETISTYSSKFMDKAMEWGQSALEAIPSILLAILVVVLSVFVARMVKRIVLRAMNRFSKNQAVMRLVANLSTVVIFCLGLFIALDILELEKTVTSLLAGAGVVGLAVGLAFQDPLLNIISGIALTIKDVPFEIGDLVKSNGYYGYVQKISLRSTYIQTITGEDVIIPNKMVLQNPIENFSMNKIRRVDVFCGVAYNSDLEKVRDLTIQCVKDNITVAQGKRIEFMYTEFGGSSINFTVRFWTHEISETDYFDNRSKVIIPLKKIFDDNGVVIPFPIRTLDVPADVLEAMKR